MDWRKIYHRVMYKDLAAVYRAELRKIGKADDYTTEYVQIFSEIPCKLAVYHERSTFHRDDTAHKQTENFMLYYSPDWEILPNDLVEIVHEGQKNKFFAGEQFKYPTHTELQLKRRKESGQS